MGKQLAEGARSRHCGRARGSHMIRPISFSEAREKKYSTVTFHIHLQRCVKVRPPLLCTRERPRDFITSARHPKQFAC